MIELPITKKSARHSKKIWIIGLSVLGGIGAAWLLPAMISWQPYDYAIYMQGARMVRAGIDPHAQLPYWYPLPITLFTTVPWSFLPDQFAWAFAFIPAGLLHLHWGRRAILWWLFFPFLINLAYAQAEGWLILPLIWLLDDAPIKSSFGMWALLFKPAYGVLLIPYRLWSWWQARRWRDGRWLIGLTIIAFGAAFVVDPLWWWHWFNGVIHRSENPELRLRNMTVWAFPEHGTIGFVLLGLFLVAFIALGIPLWQSQKYRGQVLLMVSLCFFPGGLNPVSSMMGMFLAETTGEILTLVAVSWGVAGLDALVGGFGGVYLLIVLAAMAIRVRRKRLEEAH